MYNKNELIAQSRWEKAKEDAVRIGEKMVESNMTLDQLSGYFKMSRTTVWRRIQYILIFEDRDLYEQCTEIIHQHKIWAGRNMKAKGMEKRRKNFHKLSSTAEWRCKYDRE